MLSSPTAQSPEISETPVCVYPRADLLLSLSYDTMLTPFKVGIPGHSAIRKRSKGNELKALGEDKGDILKSQNRKRKLKIESSMVKLFSIFS